MNFMQRSAAAIVHLPRVALLLTLGLGLNASAAEEATKDKAAPEQEVVVKDLVTVCASCHGPDGNGTAPNFPRLAGQHANYLAITLKNYRSGYRENAIMNGVAKELTDEAIEAIANYYAALPGKLGVIPQH